MSSKGIAYDRGVNDLISMQIARKLLGDISLPTVYRLKDEGLLGPVYKIGGAVRVTRSGVVDYLNRCRES